MSESPASTNQPPYRTVHVDLPPRSDGIRRDYDVLIGRGLLNKIKSFMQSSTVNLNGSSVVIHDEHVPEQFILAVLNSNAEHIAGVITVTPGEQSKSLANKKKRNELNAIFKEWYKEFDLASKDSTRLETALIDHVEKLKLLVNEQNEKSLTDYEQMLSMLAGVKLSRSGSIIAIGGGVTGDLAGFVAATYLRGINFVQVPTTLLAMVDSSVGGKTGVNLPEGKNLVGAFYQPKLVVADLDTLATLPPREFAAGMAEVIKYGAIADLALFDRVTDTVLPNAPDLAEIIERCVAIKARIVEQDEFETGTQRALLNFGHTIGHAIEKATGYKTYLHGEAIGLGMRAAAWLSHWHLGLSEGDVLALEVAIHSNGLPMQLNKDIDPATIRGALGNDKKVASDGKNRWVLLNKLGEATGGHQLPDEMVDRAIERLYPPSVMKKMGT